MMLGFAGNNYLIASNHVHADSTGYYNQVVGNTGIAGLTGYDEPDSPKASYISAYVSTILWNIHAYWIVHFVSKGNFRCESGLLDLRHNNHGNQVETYYHNLTLD